jgi:hypothetical protein
MRRSCTIALPTDVFDVTGLLWTDFRLKRPVNKIILLQRFPIQVESPLTMCLESLMLVTVFKVLINLNHQNPPYSAV